MSDLMDYAEECLSKPCELHSEHEKALYALRDCVTEMSRLMAALKDSRAEIERLSAVGEPMAWINKHYLKVLNDGRAAKREMMAQCANAQIKDTDVALYTAPPSIEALIAELDKYQNRNIGERPFLSEIIDKYRSKP